MLRRVVLAILCFLCAIAWQTPASLADSLLQHVTKGSAALVGVEGSLWSGSAMLAVPDPATGRFVPFMPIRWDWQPSFLLRGELRWQFSSSGNEPGAIAAGLRGASLEMLRISMPARYAMERIPNAVGRAGWRGDILLFVQRWQCNWQRRCDGDANLQWFGAGSDLFPLRQFGDYQLNVRAQDGVMALQLATTRGEIQIQANGQMELPAHVELTGTISGDPTFVGRLPNIAGNIVSPDGAPGRMRFSIHQ